MPQTTYMYVLLFAPFHSLALALFDRALLKKRKHKRLKEKTKTKTKSIQATIFFCSVGKNIHAHLGDAVTVDQWNH